MIQDSEQKSLIQLHPILEGKWPKTFDKTSVVYLTDLYIWRLFSILSNTNVK